MRASVSSDEIASAKISCSERSLKFLATTFSLIPTLFFPQRRIGVAEGPGVTEEAAAEEAGVADGAAVGERAGFAEGADAALGPGVAEGAGVAEEEASAAEEARDGSKACIVLMRTVVPVARESEGLTITLSDSVTPLRISDWTPKSRPTLTLWSCTTPLASTTPTCRSFPRNMKVLSGRIRIFPKTL